MPSELPFNAVSTERDEHDEYPVGESLKFDNTLFERLHRKSLHVIHVNARSLRNTIVELALIAEKTCASIITVSETWLDSSIINSEVYFTDYYIVRKDRDLDGSRVCIFIKDSLSYNPRRDVENHLIEAARVDILLKKTKPILIGCISKPA